MELLSDMGKASSPMGESIFLLDSENHLSSSSF